MAYVIKRTDQGGGYLAPSGSAHSYVKHIEQARRFGTHRAACNERCVDNEVVVDTSSFRVPCKLEAHCEGV